MLWLADRQIRVKTVPSTIKDALLVHLQQRDVGQTGRLGQVTGSQRGVLWQTGRFGFKLCRQLLKVQRDVNRSKVQRDVACNATLGRQANWGW